MGLSLGGFPDHLRYARKHYSQKRILGDSSDKSRVRPADSVQQNADDRIGPVGVRAIDGRRFAGVRVAWPGGHTLTQPTLHPKAHNLGDQPTRKGSGSDAGPCDVDEVGDVDDFRLHRRRAVDLACHVRGDEPSDLGVDAREDSQQLSP